MIITKQLEAEIIQFLDTYWEKYITGDFDTWSTFLINEYKNIGTNQEEIWLNKKEILDYSLSMADQLIGKLKLKNKTTQVYPLDPYILAHEFGDMYIKVEDEWVFYAKLRLSSILQQTDTGWKVLHQHGSFPDAKTEDGEFLAFEDISRENAELRDAIKRRTAELELKNRELEIEAALDRVRARSMAMHKSEELAETAYLLFQEFRSLENTSGQATIGIINEAEGNMELWLTVHGNQMNRSLDVPLDEPIVIQKLYKGWKAGEKSMVIDLNKKDLEEYNKFRNSLSDVNFKTTVVENRRVIQVAFFSQGLISLASSEPNSDSSLHLLSRFANVFDHNYRRFLDLQKAEAQAREAEIEAALEKVRSRSLAMHRSNELNEVVAILFEKLKELQIPATAVGLGISIEGSKDLDAYVCGENEDGLVITNYRLPFFDNIISKDLINTLEKQLDYFVGKYSKEEKNSFYNYLFEHSAIKDVPEDIKSMIFGSQTYTISMVAVKNTVFNVNHFEGNVLAKNEVDIIKRFAKVFEQAYIRFLDLQKAEAQARESQIETALEKVRSRSIGMQKSEELKEVIQIIHDQLIVLNFEIEAAGFTLNYKQTNDWNIWMATKEASLPSLVFIPYFDHPQFRYYIDAKKKGLDFLANTLSFEEKNSLFEYMFKFMGDYPQEEKDKILSTPGIAISQVFMKNISLWVDNYEGIPYTDAENEILKRFARVFEQAFVRFTDLEHAEAQAREAQIEAAIEKIRSRTMAMQHSDELTETSYLLDQQVRALGIKTWGCAFSIYRENDSIEWFGNEAGILPTYTVPREGIFKEYYEIGQKGESFYVKEFSGQQCIDHYEFMSTLPVLGDVLRKLKETNGSYPEYQIDHVAFFKYGYLLFVTIEHVPESYEIFKRFAKVFEQTYTRFLDLQKSEAQAKESQIQLALERVRARTMAMHQSEELAETAAVVFQQMTELGVTPERLNICLINEDNNTLEVWSTDQNGIKISHHFDASLDEPTTGKKVYNAWKAKKKSLVIDLSGSELNDWVRYVREVMGMTIKEELLKDHRIHSVAFFSHGMLLTTTNHPLPEDSMDLLKRFADVFNLTYTRFLDLQRAEEQAREAEIELALERVRSQAMAMQKSSDLLDIVVTMRNEFTRLGHEAHYFWHMMWLPEKYEKAMTSGDGTRIGMVMELPRHIHGDIPLVDKWEKSKEPLVVYPMDTQAAIDYVDKMIRLGDFKQVDPNAPSTDDIRHIGGLTFIMARTTHGEIGYSLPGVVEQPPKEDLDILVRLAGAFDIAHQRFLDLQKSEAQSREVEIELALEKVRSRSMGMQKSEELKEVIRMVFQQLAFLKIKLDHAGFVVDYKPKGDWHFWIADDVDIPSKITHPYFESVWARQFNEAKEKGTDLFTTNLDFEEKNKFYTELLSYIPELPKASKEFYLTCPGLAATTVLCEDISLYIENFDGNPYSDQENKILLRFGKVFQQSYTRFLDLQKAEAQAKEAQIETALERVRAQTMAMNKSEDLQQVVAVIFKELDKLDLKTMRCGIGIINEENRTANVWTTTGTEDGDIISFSGNESMDVHPILQGALISWKKQEDFYYELTGDDLINYYNTMGGDNYKLPDAASGAKVSDTDRHYYYCTFFSAGGLYFFSEFPFPQDLTRIIRRFANAFSLSYKRFEDLKLSEEQAYKAKIEIALERVRARALAMQAPEELLEVAQVLRHEMGLLGIEELETASIFIHDEDYRKTECWYAIKGTGGKEGKLVSDHFTLNISDTWVGREMLKFYATSDERVSIVMEGKNRLEWIKYCEEKSIPLQGYYGEIIPDRTYHLYKFSDGAIGAAAPGDISEESWELLRRASSVFSLAYSRFKDLTQARVDLIQLKTEKQRVEEALSDLKAAQSQLVQAEKMASLGELTAGIAHEIQNPLNFVNNFSDINTELIDELEEEVDKGNLDEVKAIAKDIKENEQKINHHGKRADAIVKGMLQHSRSSSGTKEPTDINALADEYFRLAYYGLRAKDKSFNAKMETDFDDAIPPIKIVPQDIGRVILNLITNAFYAVNEKKNTGIENYEPTVKVTTCLLRPPLGGLGVAGVEISITDNGNGIPKAFIDKIFQPFFTTKPTGQGTGLGLSLSYDIIKAHNGELTMKTIEGKGTTFTILLNNSII